MKNIITDTPLVAGRFGLLALGGVSTLLWSYAALAMPTSNRLDHLVLFLAVFAALFGLYLAAIGAIRRSPRRVSIFVIVVFAVVFRLLAILAGLPAERTLVHLRADLTGARVAYEPFLLYDNDLWRYLWDGHTTAEGLNPYLVTPLAATEVEVLERRLLATENWRDVHGAVSFRNYGTIYPPLVHFFFAGLAKVAPASAAAAKLALAAVDLLLCLLLWRLLEAAGRRGELVLAYAWNPAVIKEISGSGHPDVLMMLPLVATLLLLARGRVWAGGATLAASILAKLASAVTVPLVAVWSLARWRRGAAPRLAVATAAILALGLWPLAAGLGAWAEALGVFAQRWTFNSGVWASLHWIYETLGAPEPARMAHLTTGVTVVAGSVWIALRAGRSTPLAGIDGAARVRSLSRGVFHTLALVILLSPAVMPWYVLWALPAAIVAGNRWWAAFTGLALLSYLNYADGVGAAVWWKWLEYGTLAAIIAWEARRRPSF